MDFQTLLAAVNANAELKVAFKTGNGPANAIPKSVVSKATKETSDVLLSLSVSKVVDTCANLVKVLAGVTDAAALPVLVECEGVKYVVSSSEAVEDYLIFTVTKAS